MATYFKYRGMGLQVEDRADEVAALPGFEPITKAKFDALQKKPEVWVPPVLPDPPAQGSKS